MIEVKDEMLQQAAGEGMDAFIKVFTDAYMEALGGKLTAENMALLTGEQHTLLAYVFFRDEVMEGGFCQLIQNGYGGYIFDNPFARSMRLWGVGELGKLVLSTTSTVPTWSVNVPTRSSWPCTSSTKPSTTWRTSLWRRRNCSRRRWLNM